MKPMNNQSMETKLNKARAIIDQFINYSNDLKSPLTSIEGLAIVAENCTNPQEINRCLILIQDYVGKMLSMIRTLEETTDSLKGELTSEETENDNQTEAKI